MRIILFGASGMVGASALREALKAPEVESVLCIGRRSCGIEHHKLRELRLPDLFDFAAVEDQLTGFDACIWAIGISSVGLDEIAYAKVTEELTLAWADVLLRLNPEFSFCYCSAGGAGGRPMWPWSAAIRQKPRASWPN
ncbi:NAD-dependent epimerase/dehydratase family protein [Ralstonia pseudosolanacearum]|uniref:NAD-dependent epimerase/dehydratase family protein n=1 Tax=Ralstonia pseudosolanacearum TaxID=1310165 RepID=UPI001FFA9304|nr:NAD-dependent epimerase/dehydratase family protein [Ralstonia pseudosolanacearum]